MLPVAEGCGGWTQGCAGISKLDFECFMKYLKNKPASEFQRARYLGWQIAGLLLLSLWAACKKGELPPSSSDVPVFIVGFSTDSFNNQSVTAGENEVYLFTRYFTEGQEISQCWHVCKRKLPGWELSRQPDI